jgi:HAD superfamily hydrolase (TIGR01490 family)
MSGRKFAVFDIDGTLIRWQLYHALADALAQRGHIEPKSYQAMRDARLQWKRRSGSSFKDYERQVVFIYEKVLQTLKFDQLDEAIDAVFEEYRDQVYTYTRDLIADLKQKNYLLFAISGSQTEIVAKIADYYGFDDYEGTVYARAEKGFSGQKSTRTYLHKDQVLKDMMARHKVGFGSSLAIGDSRSDAAMLELVEQPIAFNPDAELFKIAKDRGWKTVLERKNMVYELEKQGSRYELVKTSSR